MNFLPLIEAKRDGQPLSSAQLREMVAAYTAAQIPEYQMAAFLMAVFFRGLNQGETEALTLAMRDSGTVLSFPKDARPVVDKHSTGGVGDKVSLPLAPLLACLGFRVPMISGRGLGITGGTLDKLDSIPGFRTLLPVEQLQEVVHGTGCVICGQTNEMVPADKGLYALRDVTATVPSIPLIVASILSKKLAEGLDALILDVKFGRAAFMPTVEAARALAKAMVSLGNDCGVHTRALLSSMDVPLGRAAGNWLEVRESVECLQPGSTEAPDLKGLVVACAAHLLLQSGQAREPEEARTRAHACLDSGQPRAKWDEMLQAQGADLDAFARKLQHDHTAPAVVEVRARQSGYVTRCDARVIGGVIRDLGGGRLRKDAVLDYDVGIDRLVKPGEQVQAGEILGRVHAKTAEAGKAARDKVEGAFELSDAPPTPLPLVREVVTEA